jgi:hypothetical protein
LLALDVAERNILLAARGGQCPPHSPRSFHATHVPRRCHQWTRPEVTR